MTLEKEIADLTAKLEELKKRFAEELKMSEIAEMEINIAAGCLSDAQKFLRDARNRMQKSSPTFCEERQPLEPINISVREFSEDLDG